MIFPKSQSVGGDEITEGNTALFTIVADIAREFDLTIGYIVTDADSNFMKSNQITNGSITLNQGSTEIKAELLIETELDSIDELDGDITVTLQNDTNIGSYLPSFRNFE